MWPVRFSASFFASYLVIFSLLVLTWTCEGASAQPKYHRKLAAAADAGASALSLKAELSKQHLISASASMRGSGIRRSNLALDKLRASKLASPLSYNATLLNTWGFKQAGCGMGDFLVADTGMVDRWICATEGEQLVTAAMDRILSAGCRRRDGRPSDALFLDVGSNSGFYGLNAIAHGCVAAFFDVQPGCNKVVNAALLVNGFTNRGVVMAAGLSDKDDIVPASSESTCSFESGRFPISAIETDTLNDGDVNVPVLPLSQLLLPSSASTRVFLMKIDTEGLEQRVLAGAMSLFKKKKVEHAIVEVTPGHGFWEKRGVDAADVANTMRDIASCGYSFTRLGSSTSTKISDPKQVHALFSTRDFTQEDFLISKT